MKKDILVVDIGGSHVKLMISQHGKRRKFESGSQLAPNEAVAQIGERTADWKCDAIAIGFPAPVSNGEIMKDPKHLGKGWAGFDFANALGKPVRVINDAALQALGSYQGGGRMLFLGLGTGLGSALVWEEHVLSLELGDLPHADGGVIEDVLGDEGKEKLGKKAWRREAVKALKQLKLALIADYIVLGGGNAKLIKKLPEGVVLGHNRHAYRGGCRLWESDPTTGASKWRVM